MFNLGTSACLDFVEIDFIFADKTDNIADAGKVLPLKSWLE